MAGVGYVVAFGGGVASFVSPCVLPVVPAYLSMLGGLSAADDADATEGTSLIRVARETALFVAGFGAVFIVLGVSATELGRSLLRDRVLLARVSGGVIVAMALFLAGSRVLRLPALYGEKRLRPNLSRFGVFAAPVAGVAFGLGWTPCIGPVLTSVLAVAATERGLGEGALLLGLYALGLGVPFLLVGLGLSRLAGALGFARRHAGGIVVASSALLALFGVLLLWNRLSLATSLLSSALRAVGLSRLLTIG
jgi:cytochrome c-type biogenesis protein